ncbi:hypothetical protein [uncultured Eubacterium sp.]|uniref:beta-xylosidase family glycoside hydrolase n=1 Tax=uncultured Eubacterium sp. TaxID=165185 RepID=UPI0026724C58|nr:hypothetical protein [uncultured Eubacterium sp.]
MTNFKLENGTLFMEDSKEYVMMAMNENYNGTLNFKEHVSPYLRKEMIGDYEIEAKFTPMHMSFNDSYGIYSYCGENYVYIALQAGGDRNIIQSGSCDFMETENPLKSVDSESVYLRLKKDGHIYETFFSIDGHEFISCGKNILDSDFTSRIGFKISTFQGSEFYVKISEIRID